MESCTEIHQIHPTTSNYQFISYQVKTRQDLGSNGVEDMVTISDLNEASILWNLRIRYDNQNIYTHIGKLQKHCFTIIKEYFKAQNKL